ncbi:MAG: DUF3307 domain-containing protein [Anaerolineales bacterium]|jgi:hypothetical protein
MESTIALILAHLLADFPLQTNLLYELKRSTTAGLWLHSGMHAVTAFLLTGLRWDLWYVWLFLLVSHALTDWVKLNSKIKKQWVSFLVDQTVHILVMVLIARWQPTLTSALPRGILYPAFALAWLPAILMFLWVYADEVVHDLAQTHSRPPNWARWMQANLLQTSRVSGYPAILVAIIGILLT